MLSLYLHLSSLNLCYLNFAVDVILFGLDFLSIGNLLIGGLKVHSVLYAI